MFLFKKTLLNILRLFCWFFPLFYDDNWIILLICHIVIYVEPVSVPAVCDTILATSLPVVIDAHKKAKFDLTIAYFF